MFPKSMKKFVFALGIIAGAWLIVRYFLPFLMPFLVGAAVALAAEPAVRFSEKKLRLPRGAAAGVCVTATLVLLMGVLSMLAALAVKELGRLANAAPNLEDTAKNSMLVVQDWLIAASDRAPEGIQPLLQRTVLKTFDGGAVLMERVSERIPGMLSAILSWVPNGLLGIGTGLISAYLISARLPKIRSGIRKKLPRQWTEKYLPALRRMRTAVGGWFRAQIKLALITYIIVTVGFLLLAIPYAPVWAALVALVDAVPMLGTGTILLPYALVSVLQSEYLRAIWLVCIYGVSAVTRAVLEPRLVGRQLGLDPLVTLLALYCGFRLWGVLGMLLAPILATAVKSALEPAE